jgi:hypothetical protein
LKALRTPEDRLAVDRLEELQNSEGWEMLSLRMEAEIEREMKKLMVCSGADLPAIQATARTWRNAQELAERMRQEILTKLRNREGDRH